jgi:predicted DNA-binding protein with PD1-like motif
MDLHIEVLRLAPGDDMRAALQALFGPAAAVSNPTDPPGSAAPVRAACVISAIGSLTRAVLRYAGEPGGSVIDGPLELLTLAGTLGAGGVHLHASVSDAEGRVYGGHLMPGCTVRTTAEIVLGLLPNHVFERVPDPATGYLELLPRRVQP